MIRQSRALGVVVLTGCLFGPVQPLLAVSLRFPEEPILADSLCKPREGTNLLAQQLLQLDAPETDRPSTQTVGLRSGPDWLTVLGLTNEEGDRTDSLTADSNCEAGAGGSAGGGGGGSGGSGGGSVLSGFGPRSAGTSPQPFLASLPPAEDSSTETLTPNPSQPENPATAQAVPLESDLAGVLTLGLLSYGLYRRRRGRDLLD